MKRLAAVIQYYLINSSRIMLREEWKKISQHIVILYARRKGWGRGLPTRMLMLFPPVCLSFMAPVIVSKCSEDAAHFILHIHTLAVILYCLENLYKMTVSVWILFP